MVNSPFNNLRQLSIALLAAGVLTGCSMAPTYERPQAPIESSYATSDVATIDIQANRLGWRDFFPDQRLQAYIAAALENNRDLRIAALNIEAARAQYGITRADRLPNFAVTATDSRGRVSSVQSVTGQSTVSETYQVGLGLAAFELDFFGRIKSLSDAALASYLASEEARQSAQISLVAQVAQAYLAERSYSEQLAISEKTLQTREDNLALAKKRFDVGASSALDLQLSETLVQSARIANATLKRQRDQANNALTLLAGKKLNDLPPGLTLSEQNIVTNIPAGLPSDLLERRPDIRQAEQNLLAANANIGAARAAFFPRISLTAGIGTASNALGDLFDSGFGTWSFIPQITLPIFEGGRNKANLDLSNVRKNIAVANYEKTIQTAFKEVADALSGRLTLEEQVKAQEAFLRSQEERLRLTQLRYDNGVASSLDLLDAQRELFTAQQGLIQARQLRFTNAIDLYRALGGGLAEFNEITPPTQQ
jgi:multidrug efflux system outer membrane protein